ncbi:hypothetical protein G9A89_002500 [Geosiphon pyriformis]|nr:hypothetical protein G9A89_002500 [Geosiphon pyriformis]
MSSTIQKNEKTPPIFRGFQREQLSGFFKRLESSFKYLSKEVTSTEETLNDEQIKILEIYLASEAKRWYNNVNWNDWQNGKPGPIKNSISPKPGRVPATYDQRKAWMFENFPFHSIGEKFQYKDYLKQGPLESPKNFYQRIVHVLKEKGLKDNVILESRFVDGLYPQLRIYIPQITTKSMKFAQHVDRVDKQFHKMCPESDLIHSKSDYGILKWTGVFSNDSPKSDDEKFKKLPPMGAVLCLKQGFDESPWDYYIRLGDACEHDGIDVDQSRKLLFYRGLNEKVQEEEKVWNASNLEEQVAMAHQWWMKDYWKNRHHEAHLEFAKSKYHYEQVEETDYQFSHPRYSVLPLNGGSDEFFYDIMQPNVDTSPTFAIGDPSTCSIS